MFSYYKTLSVMTNTGVTQKSKGRLLYALEGVDELKKVLHEPKDELVKEEDNDAFLNATMLDVMECERDLDDSQVGIDELDVEESDIDSSVERLEGIAAAISKHGICAPMMEAADPDRELVDAGICCAYEELSVVPVQDVNATTTVEGIGDALKAYFNGGSIFYGKFGRAFLEYYVNIVRAFKSYDSALSGIEKRVPSISAMNETYFEAKTIKGYSHEDFVKAIASADKILKVINAGGINKVVAEFESMISGGKLDITKAKAVVKEVAGFLSPIAGDASVTTATGLKIEVSEDKISVTTGKPSITSSKGEAGKLGWKASEVAGAVKSALSIIRGADVLANKIKAISELCKTYERLLKAKASRTGEVDADEKAALSYILAKSKEVIGVSRTLTSATESAMRKVCTTALSVGKAAIKSVGKTTEKKEEAAQEELVVIAAVSQEELDAIAEVEAATEALAAANQEVADLIAAQEGIVDKIKSLVGKDDEKALKAAEEKVEEAKAKVEKIREKIAAKKAEEKDEEKKETKAEEKKEEEK